MQKVVSTLKAIISSGQDGQNIDPNVDPSNSPSIGPSIDYVNEESTSFEGTIDINKDLSIGSNINALDNIDEESKSQTQVSIMNPEHNSLKTFIQITNTSRDSFDSIVDNFNNKIVDKLVTFVIKKHDEGVTFDHIQQLIEQ